MGSSHSIRQRVHLASSTNSTVTSLPDSTVPLKLFLYFQTRFQWILHGTDNAGRQVHDRVCC